MAEATTEAVTPGARRSRERHAYGFALSAVMLVTLTATVAAPSPVYPLYQAEWSLGPGVLSLMFAIYVVGLLIVLITAGSLSDHIGRRLVILAAASLALLALVILVLATGVGAVLVARVVQGSAMALGMGALGAALLDFAPPHGGRLAATLNGALPPFGLAVGSLLGGVFVQFEPDPTRLVFVVLSVAVVVLGAMAFFLPEAHPRRPGALASLRPALSLPARVRPVFFAVLGCMLASWALAGLYLGMGATLVRGIFHAPQAVVGGLAIACVTGVGALTGMVGQRLDARHVMITGAIALVVGPLLVLAAVQTGQLWLMFLGNAVGGIGFGGGFQGGLRLILAEAPEADRAGLLSTVYLVSYFAFGAPCLLAGLLTPTLGLRTVVIGYGVFVSVLSAIALALQLARRGTRTVELEAVQDELAHS
ncbi:MFS transporter [Streptomyces hygroscopicus]|uniref:MFS transporter n=1 Tax=Streptomyces hygroscopicus TaxID=1912 RepID=UPI0036BD708E